MNDTTFIVVQPLDAVGAFKQINERFRDRVFRCHTNRREVTLVELNKWLKKMPSVEIFHHSGRMKMLFVPVMVISI